MQVSVYTVFPFKRFNYSGFVGAEMKAGDTQIYKLDAHQVRGWVRGREHRLRKNQEPYVEQIQLHYVSFKENIFKLHERHEIALSYPPCILKVWGLLTPSSINHFHICRNKETSLFTWYTCDL